MIKQIKKIGNGNALCLDKAILELIGLEEGGEVQLTIHNGSIVITPANPKPIDEERFKAALDQVVNDRREVLQRLSE